MTTNVGDIYYEISADVAPLLQGQQEVDKALDSMERSFNKTTKAADTLDTGLSKLTSAIKGVIAASALREMAEMVQKYQEMAERVQMATSSQAEFQMVQQRLLTTANGTYRSLQEAQELYIRTADSLRSMQYTTSQAIDVQDSMSYAFVKNATSADRAGAAIDAFSKSINTGKVAADQWETLTTAIPSVINDIAAASKITGAEVRALGAAGQLTAKQLTEGLRQSLEANSAAAAGMSNNLVDASVRIKTAITQILVAFESETGVIQGFTNGLIASADGMLKFSQNADKMAGVIDASTTAALVFAGVIGARYVGAIYDSTKAKVQTIAASRQQILADSQSAQTALVSANATMRKSVADKEAAMSALALAQAEYNVARGSAAEMLAMDALVAAKTRATAAAIQNKLAEDAQAAASTQAAAAARAASISYGLASKALGLVGGPAGAAMLAASAIFYFWQKSQQAREEAIAFADGLDKLNSSMTSMSNTSLRGSIADANVAIKGQQDALSALDSEIKSLTASRDDYVAKGKQFGTTAEQGNGLLQNAAKLTDEINQKQRDRTNLEDKLNATIRTRDSAQTTLNNNMLTSMGVHDRLIEKGTVLEQVQGAVAKAFGATANEINRANQAGQNFNPRALEISPPTQAGDKVILNLEEQNSLLKIQDERLRAVTKAGIEAAKATSNPNQIAAAKRLAGENFDLQKSEEARKKAASEAESQGKRDASQAESIAQKLDKLRQQSDLTTESIEKRRIHEAGLNAQQSLGSAATKQQLAEAKALGEANEKAAISLQKRKEAEQGQKFAKQEIAAGNVSVNPITGGAGDPLAQINLQETQKLEALAKYQELDKQNTQLYEDAKTAIQLQASNARMQIAQTEAEQQRTSVLSIIGSASQGLDSLASIIANSAGKSSAAYQVMFAASKAFAIAQSTLSLNTAIMQAMADPTALTPAQKLANYAAIASAGASLLSNVASISMGGAREHGGPVSANAMYRVGEGGKPEIFKASNGSQYMIPGDNGKVISNRDMQGGGGAGFNYSPVIHVNGDPTEQQLAMLEAAVKRGAQQGYRMAVNDVASGKGKLSNALSNNFNTSQRLT
ncbi:TPA: tape measure protein [Escherichia coli]|nr:tape measure protein [Escherichia coli]